MYEQLQEFFGVPEGRAKELVDTFGTEALAIQAVCEDPGLVGPAPPRPTLAAGGPSHGGGDGGAAGASFAGGPSRDNAMSADELFARALQEQLDMEEAGEDEDGLAGSGFAGAQQYPQEGPNYVEGGDETVTFVEEEKYVADAMADVELPLWLFRRAAEAANGILGDGTTGPSRLSCRTDPLTFLYDDGRKKEKTTPDGFGEDKGLATTELLRKVSSSFLEEEFGRASSSAANDPSSALATDHAIGQRAPRVHLSCQCGAIKCSIRPEASFVCVHACHCWGCRRGAAALRADWLLAEDVLPRRWETLPASVLKEQDEFGGSSSVPFAGGTEELGVGAVDGPKVAGAEAFVVGPASVFEKAALKEVVGACDGVARAFATAAVERSGLLKSGAPAARRGQTRTNGDSMYSTTNGTSGSAAGGQQEAKHEPYPYELSVKKFVCASCFSSVAMEVKLLPTPPAPKSVDASPSQVSLTFFSAGLTETSPHTSSPSKQPLRKSPPATVRLLHYSFRSQRACWALTLYRPANVPGGRAAVGGPQLTPQQAQLKRFQLERALSEQRNTLALRLQEKWRVDPETVLRALHEEKWDEGTVRALGVVGGAGGGAGAIRATIRKEAAELEQEMRQLGVLEMEAFEWGCFCGEVRGRSQALPMDAQHCHCGMCRKFCGGFCQTWGFLHWELGMEFVRKGTIARPNGAAEPVCDLPGLAPQESLALRKTTSWGGRHFCTRCATPLSISYRGEEPKGLWLAVGSLRFFHEDAFAPKWGAISGEDPATLKRKKSLPDLADDLEDGLLPAAKRPRGEQLGGEQIGGDQGDQTRGEGTNGRVSEIVDDDVDESPALFKPPFALSPRLSASPRPKSSPSLSSCSREPRLFFPYSDKDNTDIAVASQVVASNTVRLCHIGCSWKSWMEKIPTDGFQRKQFAS